MKFLALASSVLSLVSASDLALYWGQASAGSQKSLADYCQNSPGDIYIISFITTFGSGRQMAMNIAGYNDFISGTQLLNAPELGNEIKTCQSLGKKVLISLGGAAGSYGFDSAADAESVAQDVWNYFGGGTSATRPFGDAKLDGFDLDGENNIDAQYYVPFVNKLRELYSTDSSKQYYVSAAPQCPFPDATVGQAVAQADLDFLFVQFYNNYCSLTGSNFNWDTWQSFATSSSPNKNVKLFVGLAGSPSAAGSGYATIDEIKAKKSEYSTPNFGGFMVWDASQANNNIVDGQSFAQQLKNIEGGSQPAPSTSSSSPAPAPTTSSSSSVPAPASSTTAPGAPAPVTTSPAAVVSTSPAAAPIESTSSSSPAGGNPVVTVQSVVTATVGAAGNGANDAAPTVTVVNNAGNAPNYQYVDTTSTTHSTSTVVSHVQSTSTITSEPATATSEPATITSEPATITSEPVRTTSAPLTRYTSNGEVYVVDYTYHTDFTTVWVDGPCSTASA